MSYTLALNSGPITGNEHKEGIYEVCKDLFFIENKAGCTTYYKRAD